MSMSEPLQPARLQRLQAYFCALDRGDPTALDRLYSPDTVVHVGSETAGVDTLRAQVHALWDAGLSLTTTVHDWASHGDLWSLRLTHAARRGPRIAQIIDAAVWMRFVDDRVHEVWIYRHVSPG